MDINFQANKVIETLRGLSDRERSRFLAGLLGVLAIDSPKTIVDCAGWSEIEGLKAFRYPPPDIDDDEDEEELCPTHNIPYRTQANGRGQVITHICDDCINETKN